MELTPRTKVSTLLRDYDFMLDFLADYAPEFAKLKNPVLRNTMGRVATLQMAAALASLPVEQLMEDLARAIQQRTGQQVSVTQREDPALDGDKITRLKEIIGDLHRGRTVAEVKSRFAALAADVSPQEIAAMEQQLMAEGLPQEEIKRLCDVHVEVFRESLAQAGPAEVPPGHPVHTFRLENERLEQAAETLRQALSGLGQPPELTAELTAALEAALGELGGLELHYQRKEHQLFPFLEKRGVAGPSRVMWALHDDIRAQLKAARAALAGGDPAALTVAAAPLARQVSDMIYKEQHILFPLALELLEPADWLAVRQGEAEIGYAVPPAASWAPAAAGPAATPASSAPLSRLPLDTGLLSLEQLNLLLKALPVDISLVDEHDEVRYYSDTPERVFPRSPAVIGRKVQFCHPQKSVHLVNRILQAFRAGERDTAEFWIQLQGRFLYIRYVALRDNAGAYRGTLEVSQDVTAIRALQGEQRLLSWEEPES